MGPMRAPRKRALEKPILSKEGWEGPCPHKQQFTRGEKKGRVLRNK